MDTAAADVTADASQLIWSVRETLVGELLLTGNGSALTGLFFSPHRGTHGPWERCLREGTRRDDDKLLADVSRQLAEYFAGDRTEFDVPMAAPGSRFQHRVWAALCEIPYGVTASYGEIAVRLGLPLSASRAVGLANGSNPISIIVPCHRVIGADGSLTGYGGGLPRKRFLLDLESSGSTLF